jgi:hypothetical protein
MTDVVEMQIDDWTAECGPALQDQAITALEEGSVLFFPRLGFPVKGAEAQFFAPAMVGRSKNVSFDMSARKLRAGELDGAAQGALQGMMERFAQSGHGLLRRLLPQYVARLTLGRTSFRPVEIAGRTTSWRKDDTRLHVDSFPSSPVRDCRILRLFTNVNPHGKSRNWRLGEPFEAVARRFLPSLSRPVWGSSQALRLLRITRSRRSPYDHFMLQLHDRMKADPAYQSGADQVAYDFPAQSTWLTFTDQVSHAAMAGQYLLEQTFYLPVDSMRLPDKSPQRVLARLTGLRLT